MDNNENMNPNENMMKENEMKSSPNMSGGEEKSFGPLVGIIIIIVILIAGGLYFWNQQATSLEALAPESDTVIEDLTQQGTSDEVADIEEDLDTTDLDNLDADLDAIENELGL